MSRLKDEKLLEYYFSLPDNEDLSEEEGGDEAADELTRLDVSDTTCVDTTPRRVLAEPYSDDHRNNGGSVGMEVTENPSYCVSRKRKWGRNEQWN
jgi:hypothetical protein